MQRIGTRKSMKAIKWWYIALAVSVVANAIFVRQAFKPTPPVDHSIANQIIANKEKRIQEQKDYIQSLKEEIADAKGREDSLKVENAKIAIKYKLSREEINNIPDTVLRDCM